MAKAKAKRRRTLNMSGDDLAAWRDRRGFNKLQAAAALGLKVRMIYYFESGESVIPPTVALLCRAYDDGFRGPVDG